MSVDTSNEVKPVRVCHGCGQEDDHPRVLWAQDMHDTSRDRLFHFDCAPDFVVNEHPQIQGAVDAAKAGVRHDELRTVSVETGTAAAEEQHKADVKAARAQQVADAQAALDAAIAAQKAAK